MAHVVLLAHGSPDPRSGDAVRRAATLVSEQTGAPVSVAFLDHAVPSLVEAVAAIDPRCDVVVLPLLLSTAFHARVDVPAAVADVPRPVSLLPALGHPPEVLDAVLRRAARPVVLVAAGTRVDAERSALALAVRSSSRRTGVDATTAFATGPGLRAEDLRAPGSVLVPWLLAPGRLLDAVVASAAGQEVVGGPLLDEPTMIAAIARRASARAAA